MSTHLEAVETQDGVRIRSKDTGAYLADVYAGSDAFEIGLGFVQADEVIRVAHDRAGACGRLRNLMLLRSGCRTPNRSSTAASTHAQVATSRSSSEMEELAEMLNEAFAAGWKAAVTP
jgi:hypothetical protein